jgi:hypothetical protein
MTEHDTDADKVTRSQRWAALGLLAQDFAIDVAGQGFTVTETWDRQSRRVTIVVLDDR